MFFRLLNTCAGLWILGLIGMFVSRGFYGLGPGELPFELSARVWAVGGLSYVFLGVLFCRGSREHVPAER